VEKMLQGCKFMHEIWAAVISTGVAVYILYTHLGMVYTSILLLRLTDLPAGAAFVAPFVTVLITTAISAYLGKHMRARQLMWAAATQTRVSTISYVVGRMKGIRMLGLSNTVLSMLTKLRELEVDAHKYIRKIHVWVLLVSNVIFQLTTLSTYVTFAIIMLTKHNGSGLDFNTLYGSLSALKLVTSPLMLVIQLIPAIQTSLASLERIEIFLKDGFLEKNESSDVHLTPRSEDLELLPVEIDRSQAPLISMQDATFAVDDQALLLDITTSFRPSSFTMIIGKVRSSEYKLRRNFKTAQPPVQDNKH